MGLPSQDAQDKNLVYGTELDNVQERLEIDEMVTQQPDTLNLYLLALAELQNPKSFNAEKSKGGVDYFTYLQLGGVHGLPAVPWTGVDAKTAVKALKDVGGDKLEITEQAPSTNPDADYGYCTHGSVLFPTWHRAYLLAYEQALYNKIVEIADRYGDATYKEKYGKAAKLFRLPYWDPVMPRNETENANKNWFGMFGAPYIVTAEEVQVRMPESPEKLTKITNPLFQFSFYAKKPYDRMAWPPPLDDKGEIRPSRTTRYPTMNDNFGIDTNSVSLDKILQEQAAILARGFHRLFAVERNWFNFSNHAKADWSTFNDTTGAAGAQYDPNISLESWHDNIHDITGGGGHMSDPAKAAFDPIFWMHHCNIDRMFAMYQTQESKIYVSDAMSRAGSLAYGKGTHVGEQTPLVPFRKQVGDNGSNYWNSIQVRDWTSLGYGYADTKPTQAGTKPPDDQKVTLEKYIADRYAWITEYLPRPSSLEFPKDISNVEAIPDEWKKPRETNVPDLTPNHPGDVYPEGAIVDGKITTWDLGIRVPKFAYKNTFNIHVFLGFVQVQGGNVNDPRTWASATTSCGFSSVFANSSEETCSNCRKQKSNTLIYEDVIPITMILRRFLSNYSSGGSPPRDWRTLDGLTPTDALKDWLKKNLIVKVADVIDNREIPLEQAKQFGLKFQISQQEYTMPTTAHPLGVYGPTVSYPDLTGLRPGEFNFENA